MTDRPLIFGEVLADCFPDGSRVLGGAPFNVAWHLQAFGVRPLMVSAVGKDTLGEEILAAMETQGMDISAISIDPSRPSGMVAVSVEKGEPAYDIVDNSAWDNIHIPQTETANGGILYHGTLALRHSTSRRALEILKQRHHSVFIDINLRPPWYAVEEVLRLIWQAGWLKLNQQELSELVPQFKDGMAQLAWLHQEQGIDNIILTQGEAGACLSLPDGIACSVKPEKSIPLVDTVGAGDAFSSVMLLGIIKEWPVQQTFERAQSFAAAIVGKRGATVPDKDFYANITQTWN